MSTENDILANSVFRYHKTLVSIAEALIQLDELSFLIQLLNSTIQDLGGVINHAHVVTNLHPQRAIHENKPNCWDVSQTNGGKDRRALTYDKDSSY